MCRILYKDVPQYVHRVNENFKNLNKWCWIALFLLLRASIELNFVPPLCQFNLIER
jgi:hypothetical protein